MFETEPITRDERGCFYNSALNDMPADSFIEDAAAAEGMEFTYVDLEIDAPDLFDRYQESDDSTLVDWNPTTPAGAGWFLAAIYENESGAFAAFARPRVEKGAAKNAE